MIREKLTLLVQIEEQDRHIRELEARIRRMTAQRDGLEKEIAERREALERKDQALEELRRESRRRNDEVDSLDYQIRNYQRQLDEGIMSYREMEALKEKIEHSKVRMEELEEEAIALMDEIEIAEGELARDGEMCSDWEGWVREEIGQLEQEVAARQEEREEAKRLRSELAAGVERHLLEQYERLLRDYGYEDPIAAVEGGSCSGCKMRLSQNTLERLQEGRELVICENCRRILYWE